MKNINYINDYLKNLSTNLFSLDIEKFSLLIKKFKKIKQVRKKIILIGNGGSAAMASHVSVDLTKLCEIRAINFNEADLITCFTNDYGHDNWMKEAVKKYSDKGDLVILISSSGNSKNHIVCGNYCKKNKIELITLTGFNGNNKLSKLGDINLVANSRNYNIIEMIHHVWLLLACDYIVKSKI